MAYLIIHNRKISLLYQELLQAVREADHEHGFELIVNEKALQSDVIVTYSNIKALESIMIRMEVALGMKRSRFISNTFTPRKKQLDALTDRFGKIQSSIEKRKEELVLF